jgi:hypothetical protein
MLRSAKDVLGRAGLDDAAQVHDRDDVGQVPYHGEVMGDEQKRHTAGFLELAEDLKYLALR